MTLSQMLHFCTVVEEESFRKASEKLFVTRQAVSSSVHQLEAELRLELIQKDKNNQLLITESGLLVYKRMKSILSDVDELKNIAGPDAYENRKLHIAFSDTIAPILSRNMRNSLENVSRLNEYRIESITQLQNNELADGNLQHYDMAFLIGNSNLFPEYHTRVLSSHKCCIDVPYTHSCFNHKEITWDDLSGQTLLMPFSPESIGIKCILDQYNIHPLILTNVYSTGHTSIANACCVLDIPYDSADHDFRQLPINEPKEFEIQIFAVWKKNINPKTIKNIFHFLEKNT